MNFSRCSEPNEPDDRYKVPKCLSSTRSRTFILPTCHTNRPSSPGARSTSRRGSTVARSSWTTRISSGCIRRGVTRSDAGRLPRSRHRRDSARSPVRIPEAPRTVAPWAAVSSAASDVEYRYGADFTLDQMRELYVSSAPAAADYYPRIGFRRHTSAWVVAADDPIGSPRTDTAG
jgi:hypothetical protein